MPRELGVGATRAYVAFLPPRFAPGLAFVGKKKRDAYRTVAANDFGALERLRMLAFSDTAPAPKIPEQLPLELPVGAKDEEGSTGG